MSIEISILNDNRTLSNKFVCEHGLSVYVRCGEKSLLLDTGQSDKYVRNAESLGIDIASVDACVISHGHYDHAGGLSCFPKTSDRIPIYIGKNATRKRYSLSSVMLKPNGFPNPDVLNRFDVHCVDGVLKISDEVTLFTLPNVAPRNEHLVVDGADGKLECDTFSDEVFTIIRYEGSTVLFGGCTHHGLEQLFEFCKKQLGVSRLSAFVGGLHLSGRVSEEIENQANIASSLLRVDKWIINHCSGDCAIEYWRNKFGSIPSDGFSGSRVNIG